MGQRLPRDLMRIGDFSRLGRVSIVALRHYADLGLLVPEHIDYETGYRYYAAEQLARLHRILALKELGFSLEEIADLAGEDTSADVMRGMYLVKRAELEAQMRQQRIRLAAIEARLRQLERGELTAGSEVVLRPVAPQLAATVREVVPDAGAIEGLFERVERFAADHQARAALPPLAIYHDGEYRERDLDVEVAVPLTERVAGSAHVAVREVPGADQMACAVHAGSYATIDQTSLCLLAGITERGLRVAGPYREVYLRFGSGGLALALPDAYVAEHADDYLTELQVPVERVD